MAGVAHSPRPPASAGEAPAHGHGHGHVEEKRYAPTSGNVPRTSALEVAASAPVEHVMLEKMSLYETKTVSAFGAVAIPKQALWSDSLMPCHACRNST